MLGGSLIVGFLCTSTTEAHAETSVDNMDFNNKYYYRYRRYS